MDNHPEDDRQQRRFYRLMVMLILVGITTPLVGLAAEWFFCRDLFSRFGAVLILIELLGTFHMKNNADKERFDWLRMEVVIQTGDEEKVAEIISNVAPGKSREETATWLRSVFDKYSGRYSELTILQAVFLIVGTLMWAFGDLFVNFDKCC